MRISLGAGTRLVTRLDDLAQGRTTPPVPRDAATVMLLRPATGGAGVEVLMMLRPAAMKFAAGAYVFPGGSVDAGDYAAEAGWHGPSPEEFGDRLGADAATARALVRAAVRETFEESGVLLAGPPDGPPAVPEGESWEADRLALTAGELEFAELLRRRGLVLRADLLVPWSRWVTPEAEGRRFDARFFAATLPPGQRATGNAAEADRVAWLDPEAALDATRGGEMSLLPPTAVTLQDFASLAAGSGGEDGAAVSRILSARRTIEPVMPRLVFEGGETWLVLPDTVGYPL